MANAYAITSNSAGYLEKSGAWTGATDSKSGILAFWLKVDTSGNYYWALGPSSGQVAILTLSNSYMELAFKAGGSHAVRLTTNGTLNFVTGTWYSVLCSYDTAVPVAHLYVNDVDKKVEVTLTKDAGITNTFTASNLMALPDGSLNAAGKLSEFYWAPNQYLDFSVASNRAKFYDSGTAKWLGADGSKPTGTKPVIYMDMKDATNHGTGGAWSTNGSVTYTQVGPSKEDAPADDDDAAVAAAILGII
jgi:hypothetical protein